MRSFRHYLLLLVCLFICDIHAFARFPCGNSLSRAVSNQQRYLSSFPFSTGGGYYDNANDKNTNFLSDPAESPSLKQLFGGKGVKYVLDDESLYDPTSDNLLFVPSRSKSVKREIMEVALMPFDAPLFPGSREFLYIYEMRFRSLMNDIESNNGVLGRCFVDEIGIGSVGSLCHIVEKRKMEDGKGFFIIEATSRFRIRKILRSEPYLHAEVEIIDDIDIVSNHEICESLCRDVYSELKAYLRVARFLNIDAAVADHVVLSPAIRDNRPSGAVWAARQAEEEDLGAARHKAFSHACADILTTDSTVMQQLLQSQSVSYRLRGLKGILAEAVDELTSLVLDDDNSSLDTIAEIRRKSHRDDDTDDDLMPPPQYKGVTLESELDDRLIAQLGIEDADFVEFDRIERKLGSGDEVSEMLSSKATTTATTAATSPATADATGADIGALVDDDDDDMWGMGADAFQ